MNKILKTILCILLIMLAFSCKNQFNELSNNSTSGYGTIYFVDSSRTVLETVEKDDFTKIILYSKKSDSLEAQKISEWKSYSDFVQSTVSVAIGTYDFYLEAFAGNVKFESDEITAEIKENQKTNVNFILHLVDKGEGNGNVKITYLFGDYNVATADFKLSKVEYVDDGNGGKIRTLNNVDVSFEGIDENSEGDWNIWGDPENPEQENYCIFEKSIPAGQYELTARFESASGDYVAEYSTSVSVSEGITSSKEITIENFNPYYAITYNGVEDSVSQKLPGKYSMYDKIEIPSLTKNGYEVQGWYTDENFAEPFKGITRYGNMRGNLNLFPKWKLKESQYLLFDYESSVPNPETGELDDYYKFSMFEEDLANAEISEGNPRIPNYEFPVIGGSDFFYYFSDEGLEKSNDPGVDINLNVDEEHYISSIFYDNETDTLYGRCDEYTNNGGSSPTYVYEKSLLCKYNEDENIFTPIYETKLVHGGDSYMGMSEGMSDIFAVHNNKMYFCLNDTDNVKIYIYDGIKGYDENDEEIIEIETSNFDVATFDHLSINDMMFVDGNLYILWSYSNSEYSANYNSAAPLKIEYFGGVLCVDEKGKVEKRFTTPSEARKIDIPGDSDKALVNYYGPSTENSNTQLFGPTKFIAIKPKKLVFADEGIFVYKDAVDSNKPKYKNINRVVEMDLENNTAVKDVSVSFTKEVEDTIKVYCDYSPIYPAEQTVSAQ